MRKSSSRLLIALWLALAGPAVAGARSFGHWQVDTTGNGRYTYAATVNRGGELFGKFCDLRSASCHWLLAVRTPCRFGDVYPVLANSAAGASPIVIFCVGSIGRHSYGMALMNRRKLRASITHARRIDFALPIDGGGFALTRFALAGRLHATAVLRRAMAARIAQQRRIRSAELHL